MNGTVDQEEKELVYNVNLKARYKGSDEWIKKGTVHTIKVSKPSDDKLYYILKLYPMDISPIRMHAYLSESELRRDWEIL